MARTGVIYEAGNYEMKSHIVGQGVAIEYSTRTKLSKINGAMIDAVSLLQN